MKKYNFIFSGHTLIIAFLSFLSSYISLRFHLEMFLDFLIIGVIIAFPISFTMREAFRRREKALEYISLFKASLQSLFYCFESSSLTSDKKLQIRNILADTSSALIKYLSDQTGSVQPDQDISAHIFEFIYLNEENLKKSFSMKIFLFMFRINESINFLIATKRHDTPWAIRIIVLTGIYFYTVFYPASLLSRTGFHVALWYVFFMTFTKSFIFICLYNVQNFMVHPFNQFGPDSVKLNDFQFTGFSAAPAEQGSGSQAAVQ